MPNAVQRSLCADLASLNTAMLADLAQHVAIPTGRGHRSGIEEYRDLLVKRLHALNAEVEFHPGSPRPLWIDSQPSPSQWIPEAIVARHVGQGPRLLIAGHLDTVHDPAGPFQALTVAPDGRTATGPGAADMKGGIVIAVYALEALRRAGVEVNWTVLLNADEETGSFHSAPLLAEEARRHDLGLVVEPALPGGALAIERLGSGQFMIEVFGRAAHVGREFEKGVSAVTRLGEIVTQTGSWSEPQRGLIVNIGPLHGGKATNVVPDYAACWGNARFRDADAADELRRRLEALTTRGDDLPRVVVHHCWNRPPKPLTPGVQRLADTAARVAGELGQSLPFTTTGGVCDGNILQDAGLPTIDTLGVRGGALHTTDEWIEVDSLVQRAQLLAALILDLNRQP